MALAQGTGPFGERPAGTWNFAPSPPEGHALYLEPFPRRVRGVLGGVTVLDSDRVRLLHETGRPPVYYVPEDDVPAEHTRPSTRRTRCPYKGEARYRSLVAGERVVADAVWSYPVPIAGAPPLAGLAAIAWDALDRWTEEDEEVHVHPRDPYHRVDVLASSRRVRVRVGGELVAESRSPRMLYETGLPPRAYLAPEDVRAELLVPSGTRTRCPYKGLASYRSLRVGGRLVEDAAWLYPEPLREAEAVAGRLSFDPERVAVEIA